MATRRSVGRIYLLASATSVLISIGLFAASLKLAQAREVRPRKAVARIAPPCKGKVVPNLATRTIEFHGADGSRYCLDASRRHWLPVA